MDLTFIMVAIGWIWPLLLMATIYFALVSFFGFKLDTRVRHSLVILPSSAHTQVQLEAELALFPQLTRYVATAFPDMWPLHQPVKVYFAANLRSIFVIIMEENSHLLTMAHLTTGPRGKHNFSVSCMDLLGQISQTIKT